MGAVQSDAPATQAAPITYRGTARNGLKLLIELESGPSAVGQTIRGKVSFEGERRPKIAGGSASLVARRVTTSTSVDIFSMVGQAVDPQGFEDEAEPIPTKEKTTTAQLVSLKAPVSLETGPSGAQSGAFEIAIPLD